MTNLQTILVANGAAIMLLMIILFSAGKTLHHTLLDDKLFLVMVFSCALQSIMETEAFWMDGKPGSGFYLLGLISNSFLFCNNIFFAFIWTVYADFKIFEDRKRIRRIYPWAAVPACLVIIGSIVNLFTPVFYQINADNIYQRSGLYIIPYVITYLYLAYGVVLIYKYREKAQKYLFLPAIIFMIPILAGSILQFFFYGLSLVWLGAAIALTSLYINVQNEVSYIDALSGLYTRQYMNHFLAAETRRSSPEKKLAGIMFDIDHFKSINDQFGHLTGDDAIHSFGKILRDAMPQNGLAVRFAGDEFMVLLLLQEEEEIQETLKQIEALTKVLNVSRKKPYQLAFSKGYCMYDYEKDTMDKFLGRMDAAMYAEKRKKQER